jgi:cytosine/adenosine deaminase-related metal-dependent hydrolase
MGKIASRNLKAATAGEVFEAATLNGARPLGRDDIGRLAPGARADIVIIDLTGGDSLRYGPIRDPIKSLIDCGIGDDVDTVIVDAWCAWKADVSPASISPRYAIRRRRRGNGYGAAGPIGIRSVERRTR